MITIHTLANYSAQEVFGYLVEKMLVQNKVSTSGDEGDSSYYGTDNDGNFDGTRSPAGWLIPSEDYLWNFEGYTWKFHVETGRVPADHAELIYWLNAVHGDYNPEDWVKGFTMLAEDFGLSTAVIDKFAK